MVQDVTISSHYLFPSNIFVAKDPALVTTVLGSCIAVCLFDTKNKIGGINHFMLPLWNGEGLATVKYGNIATDRLIRDVLQQGAQKPFLIAKIFGGTNSSNFTMDIGKRNFDVAQEILKEHQIPIVTTSVQGKFGRKIIFNTYDGVVKMKQINAFSQRQTA